MEGEEGKVGNSSEASLKKFYETQTEEARRDVGRADGALSACGRGCRVAKRDWMRRLSNEWKQYLADPKKDHPFLNSGLSMVAEDGDGRIRAGSQAISGRGSRDNRREEACRREERDHPRAKS